MDNTDFEHNMMSIDTDSEELRHYGRKGMKWYQKIFSKFKKGGGKDGESDDEYIAKHKPVKKMTDEELKKATERIENENRYRRAQQAEKELNALNKSEGQKFAKKLGDVALDAGLSALKQVGGEWVKKQLGKAVKLDDQEDTISSIAKEAEKLSELSKDSYKGTSLQERLAKISPDFVKIMNNKLEKDRAQEQAKKDKETNDRLKAIEAEQNKRTQDYLNRQRTEPVSSINDFGTSFTNSARTVNKTLTKNSLKRKLR